MPQSLARMVSDFGLNAHQVHAVLFILVLGAVFLLRRAIVRLLSWAVKMLLTAAALVALVGGVVMAFRLGPTVGAIAAALAVLFVIVAGRFRRNAPERSAGGDSAYQDDVDRMRRDRQRREEERMRRVHAETNRRNPW